MIPGKVSNFLLYMFNKIYDSGKEKHFKTKNNRTFENKKLQI
jgi:hypothetical protein